MFQLQVIIGFLVFSNFIFLMYFCHIESFTERSYISTVTDVSVNSTYSAVLSNGGIELHQVKILNYRKSF